MRRGLRGFSVNRLIPNVLTLAALCSGLTAIRFALQGEFRLAVIAVIVAAIFDALDGRVARRLGVASRFGAELDSLSDFLCFGVTPALVLYLASLKDGGALGWVVDPDVPDLLGAAAGAFQHRLAGRHAATGLDGLLFHRRAGAGRRAAGPDSPGPELRGRGRLAASPPHGRGRRWSWSAASW